MDNLSCRKILIIDPNGETSDQRVYLGQKNYACKTEKTLQAAREVLANEKFDAIISELYLPDGNLYGLIDAADKIPVIIFSSETSDDAVVRALSAGAADYIFKPCSPRVFEARLQSRLPKNGLTISVHGVELNATLRTVIYLGKPVKLTSSEFNILRFLMTNPGKFFTADEIYENVWNASSMQTSVVRFHVANLKRTLLNITGENLIISEFGSGYSFAEEN